MSNPRGSYRIDGYCLFITALFLLMVLGIAMCAGFGCAASGGANPPSMPTKTTITVGPVIVTSGGTLPAWVQRRGLDFQDDAKVYYEPTTIRVAFAPSETIERPEWFRPDGDTRLAMRDWASARYRATGLVTAFYVEALPYPGRTIRGLSYRGATCVFLRTAHATVLAHELGHRPGLADLTGAKKCDPVRRCNLMTYCPDGWSSSCEGPLWTRKQILLMRLPRR